MFSQIFPVISEFLLFVNGSSFSIFSQYYRSSFLKCFGDCIGLCFIPDIYRNIFTFLLCDNDINLSFAVGLAQTSLSPKSCFTFKVFSSLVLVSIMSRSTRYKEITSPLRNPHHRKDEVISKHPKYREINKNCFVLRNMFSFNLMGKYEEG